MWPWIPKKELKSEKAKKKNSFKAVFTNFFCEKVNLLTVPVRGCRRCGQFDIGVTICVQWLATPLNLSGKGYKIFLQCWTTLPTWRVSNKFHLLLMKHKTKTSLLLCGRHNQSDFFVSWFYIKDQNCLKLVKCICCYSASTKTSFGFCSCSELLQLKFGEKDVAGKCKLLRHQDS